MRGTNIRLLLRTNSNKSTATTTTIIIIIIHNVTIEVDTFEKLYVLEIIKENNYSEDHLHQNNMHLEQIPNAIVNIACISSKYPVLLLTPILQDREMTFREMECRIQEC